jgi:hypothetical protein
MTTLNDLEPYMTATCHKCGHPIGISPKTSNTWAHIDPNDGTCTWWGMVSCHAASYERFLDSETETHDETLDRRWKAAPVKGSVVDLRG